jgi:hypothetical protein
MERSRPRNARVREGLAKINDITHKYLIIPFLFAGQFIIGSFWHSAFLSLVVILQLMFSNCPMTMLSAWLRKDEGRREGSGLVRRLYVRLGKWAVLPIAAYLFTIAFIVGSLAP